jgi:hypothetical protein
MSVMEVTQTEKATGLTIRILSELFDEESRGKIHVRLWDGTIWPDEAPRPVTLVLQHAGALRAMFL